MFFQRDARRMIRLLLVAVPAFPTHLRLGDIRTLRHFDFRGAVPRGFRRLGPTALDDKRYDAPLHAGVAHPLEKGQSMAKKVSAHTRFPAFHTLGPSGAKVSTFSNWQKVSFPAI